MKSYKHSVHLFEKRVGVYERVAVPVESRNYSEKRWSHFWIIPIQTNFNINGRKFCNPSTEEYESTKFVIFSLLERKFYIQQYDEIKEMIKSILNCKNSIKLCLIQKFKSYFVCSVDRFTKNFVIMVKISWKHL